MEIFERFLKCCLSARRVSGHHGQRSSLKAIPSAMREGTWTFGRAVLQRTSVIPAEWNALSTDVTSPTSSTVDLFLFLDPFPLSPGYDNHNPSRFNDRSGPAPFPARREKPVDARVQQERPGRTLFVRNVNVSFPCPSREVMP